MIAPTIRLLRDWLHTGPGSLDTLVPLVPRDAGDPVPTVPRVVDETRDGEAAREHAPVQLLPVLQVVLGEDGASVSGAAGVRPSPADTDVQIMFRLVYAATNTDVAIRDSDVILRALRRSLHLLMTSDPAQRARGSVQIIGMNGERIVPAFTPLTERTITGGMLLNVRVRDVWASS